MSWTTATAALSSLSGALLSLAAYALALGAAAAQAQNASRGR